MVSLFAHLQIGPHGYVIPARRILRILPLGPLRMIPGAPEGIAGALLCGSTPVPVVDLTQLLLHRPAARRLSTRILLVNPFEEPPEGDARVLGLIAEKLTETLELEEHDFVRSGMTATPGLGPLVALQDRLLQRLDPECLVPLALIEALYADIGVGP